MDHEFNILGSLISEATHIAETLNEPLIVYFLVMTALAIREAEQKDAD